MMVLHGVDADEAGLEADRLLLLEEEQQRLRNQQKHQAELEAQLAAFGTRSQPLESADRGSRTAWARCRARRRGVRGADCGNQIGT